MYIKLWDDILDSTIWMEEDHVVRVFLTFLLVANWDGFVDMPIPAIAQRARVSIQECIAAIEKLEAPDPFSRTKAEQGRRIIRVTEEQTLWHITNFEKRRGLRDEKAKRKHQAAYMRDWRARQKRIEAKESKKTDNKRKGKNMKPYDSLAGTHELAHEEVDKDKHTEKTTSSSSAKADSDFVNWVFNFWNAHDLKPAMKSISKQRRSSILARRRETSEAAVKEVLENRRDSNFLCNVIFDGRGAPADWVFGPKNFAKVLDGNYDSKKGGKSGGPDLSAYDSKL
jgi:hypothetical protein